MRDTDLHTANRDSSCREEVGNVHPARRCVEFDCLGVEGVMVGRLGSRAQPARSLSYFASRRLRRAGSVAISMTVRAMPRAPSKIAWSAEGVMQTSAKASWWGPAPFDSTPMKGWMVGTS